MVPIEATVIPLPTELTTPPVTKIYFDIQENQEKISTVYERQHYVGIWKGIVLEVSFIIFTVISICQVLVSINFSYIPVLSSFYPVDKNSEEYRRVNGNNELQDE